MDSQIQELIERPSESLSVEIKRWIDLATPIGKAKLVKASLAIRNHGGGFFILGFDNESLMPEDSGRPNDVPSAFHVDKVQSLITTYASDPFSVDVHFPERDGKPFVVIAIPAGIKTPVACKADLTDGERQLLRLDDVYCRTLNSNNTPSTAKAGWKDWRSITDVCFENREADIGRFIRRHIGGINSEAVRSLMDAMGKSLEPKPTLVDISNRYIDESLERFDSVVSERNLELPAHGFWEVSLVIDGPLGEFSANREFLNLLESSNPDLTGWPIWLVSRGFSDRSCDPYVYQGGWEELVVLLSGGWGDQIDFMRFNPSGKFYTRCALQDDIGGSERKPKPLTQLDFGLAILRAAEAMVVGMAFGKAMSLDIEQSTLHFAYRWTGLKNRSLSSWASPGRYLRSESAYEDRSQTNVSVPLDTPLTSISSYVGAVVAPLFQVFNGKTIPAKVIEELTEKLVNRKL